MEIAWLADVTSPNGVYRGVGPVGALRDRGHGVHQLRPGRLAAQVSLLDAVDVVLVHRFADEETLDFVRAARLRGVPVVFDDDDDANAIPRNNPGFQRVRGLEWDRRMRALRQIVQLADCVMAPSPALADRFREMGAAEVAVTENCVVDEFCTWRQRPHEGVVVGWIAGKEHHVDLERLPIGRVLARVLAEDSRVRVVTVGLRLGFVHERYEHLRKVPFNRLIEFASGFDIGIAPLADTPFNRARSNVKLKEYGAAGVPWLASDVGPYRGLGEREGGRLVAGDDWHGELTRLISRERERRKLSKRAVRWARGETLSANAQRWEAVFARVAGAGGLRG